MALAHGKDATRYIRFQVYQTVFWEETLSETQEKLERLHILTGGILGSSRRSSWMFLGKVPLLPHLNSKMLWMDGCVD